MNISFNDLPFLVSQIYEKTLKIESLLNSRSENQTKSENEEFLSIEQAAKLLNLSVPTIYGLVHKKAIPVNKRGKRLYFSNIELVNWVKSGRKKTLAEIKSEADNQLANRKKGVKNA